MLPQLMLMFQDTGTVEKLIQTLGFPIVIALAGLFFAYKVWINQSDQIKRKDTLLETQAEQSQQFRKELLTSQNQISQTQDKIFDTFDAHTEVLRDIKNVLQTK